MKASAVSWDKYDLKKKKKKGGGKTPTILPLLPPTTFLFVSQEFWSSLGAMLRRFSSLSLWKTELAKAMPIFFSVSELNQRRKGPTWYQFGTREQIWLSGPTQAQETAKPPALGG